MKSCCQSYPRPPFGCGLRLRDDLLGLKIIEAKAFGEVEQAIHTPSVVVQHDQHHARSVFRPRDQEQVIGAEVEHGWGQKTEGAGARKPPPASAAPLWG